MEDRPSIGETADGCELCISGSAYCADIDHAAESNYTPLRRLPAETLLIKSRRPLTASGEIYGGRGRFPRRGYVPVENFSLTDGRPSGCSPRNDVRGSEMKNLLFIRRPRSGRGLLICKTSARVLSLEFPASRKLIHRICDWKLIPSRVVAFQS